ncbi:hypothetical protein P171DRAFT_477728 [Karstenula rhodostoma CBS 690.94]|uniref:C3H1-type domain-containing protein n=1 Tax=Karstenula rhodostoma CBS 690.94 TaxID=1392251 RepID=A0A9P4U667_9PLEO|nr:hypothetical protein P171DRAFT_477728 [Karstenula rhodostoma CBS 690.94]
MHPSAPSSTRLDPSIRYYIHRTLSNAIVPLIPADQLPFRLKDFPRHLSHGELAAGGWRFLAETGGIAFPLALGGYAAVDSCVKIQKKTVDVKVRPREEKEGVKEEGEMAVNAVPREEAVKETTPSITETRPTPHRRTNTVGKTKYLTDSMAAIYTQDARRVGYTKPTPTTPTSKRPGPTKEKEHCRHWIRTGACKWTATREGCRYRHEMASVEKLAELGIVGVPRWFAGRGVGGGRKGEEAGPTRGGDGEKGKGTWTWTGRRVARLPGTPVATLRPQSRARRAPKSPPQHHPKHPASTSQAPPSLSPSPRNQTPNPPQTVPLPPLTAVRPQRQTSPQPTSTPPSRPSIPPITQ